MLKNIISCSLNFPQNTPIFNTKKRNNGTKNSLVTFWEYEFFDEMLSFSKEKHLTARHCSMATLNAVVDMKYNLLINSNNPLSLLEENPSTGAKRTMLLWSDQKCYYAVTEIIVNLPETGVCPMLKHGLVPSPK